MTTAVPPGAPNPLDDIRAAQQRIAGSALHTPLIRLNLDDAPAEIYFKLENLQPIGSFKLRGAGEEGAIGPAHIQAELGELLLGRAQGRRSPEQVTLFRSLGLAVEDVAAAQHLVQQVRAGGAGTLVDM